MSLQNKRYNKCMAPVVKSRNTRLNELLKNMFYVIITSVMTCKWLLKIVCLIFFIAALTSYFIIIITYVKYFIFQLSTLLKLKYNTMMINNRCIIFLKIIILFCNYHLIIHIIDNGRYIL
jgi:hypothetical protein